MYSLADWNLVKSETSNKLHDFCELKVGTREKWVLPPRAAEAMQYEEIFGAIRGLVMCSARNVPS